MNIIFKAEEVTLTPAPFVTFDGAKNAKQNEKVRTLSFHMPDTQFKYLYASIRNTLKKVRNIEYKEKNLPKDFPEKIKDYMAMLSYLYCKYYEEYKCLVTSPTPIVVKPVVQPKMNDTIQIFHQPSIEPKSVKNVRTVTYNMTELFDDKNFDFEEFNLVMMTSKIMMSHGFTSQTSVSYIFNPKGSIIKKLESGLSLVNSNYCFNLKQNV